MRWTGIAEAVVRGGREHPTLIMDDGTRLELSCEGLYLTTGEDYIPWEEIVRALKEARERLSA